MDTGWNCTLLSPLGLTRTGRAPLSLVVEPVLNDDLHACLAHLPRALIPVPDRALRACVRPPSRSSDLPTLLLDAQRGIRGGAPYPPHPLSQRLRAPDHQRRRSIARQEHCNRSQLLAGRHTRLFTAPPQDTSPRALPRTTRVYVTPPVASPSSKSVAKITTPSLTQTCR